MRCTHLFIPLLITGLFLSCSSDDGGNEQGEIPENTERIAKQAELKLNWIQTIGGSLGDQAKAIVATNDGGYAILGNTESLDGDITDHETGTQDYWIIKLDANGKLLWNKTYGGDDDDRGESITATLDGGFAVTGFSRSSNGDVSENQGAFDHWVVKVDTNGVLEWEESFGSTGDDRAFSIAQTEDKGYVTIGFLDIESFEDANEEIDTANTNRAGKSFKNLHGAGVFWVHKLDEKGTTEWEQFYGGTSNENANDFLMTPDGGYLLIGSTESFDVDIKNNNGSYDFWVVKIDSKGVLQWEQTYGGSGADMAFAVTNTTDGNYIIAGDTRSTDGDITQPLGNADIWVVKIDANGKLLNQNTFGGSDFETATDIITTKDGNYILTGSVKSSNDDVTENLGDNDIWVLKIDDKLQTVWNASYGGSGFDFGYGLVQDTNGNIVIVGDTESTDQNVDINKGIKDAIILSIKE